MLLKRVRHARWSELNATYEHLWCGRGLRIPSRTENKIQASIYIDPRAIQQKLMTIFSVAIQRHPSEMRASLPPIRTPNQYKYLVTTSPRLAASHVGTTAIFLNPAAASRARLGGHLFQLARLLIFLLARLQKASFFFPMPVYADIKHNHNRKKESRF